MRALGQSCVYIRQSTRAWDITYIYIAKCIDLHLLFCSHHLAIILTIISIYGLLITSELLVVRVHNYIIIA